jgi:hypothetical protein
MIPIILLLLAFATLHFCFYFNYHKSGDQMNKLYIIILIIGFYAILNPFLIKFGYGITDPAILGTTGDWLAGSSTPLLTFASFILLVETFRLQRKEIELTRQALEDQKEELELTRQAHLSQNETLEKQRIESAIFQGISLHNEIVLSMEVSQEKRFLSGTDIVPFIVTIKGRNVFKKLYSELKNYLYYDYERHRNHNVITLEQRYQQIHEGYYEWYIENEHYVGHYYRNLYHLFKMIHNSVLDQLEKEKYVDIVRAQLSSEELLLLFYNAISFRENNSFIPLIRQYNILKHINKERLIMPYDVGILFIEFDI